MNLVPWRMMFVLLNWRSFHEVIAFYNHPFSPAWGVKEQCRLHCTRGCGACPTVHDFALLMVLLCTREV
jgi:hypothetical protein